MQPNDSLHPRLSPTQHALLNDIARDLPSPLRSNFLLRAVAALESASDPPTDRAINAALRKVSFR